MRPRVGVPAVLLLAAFAVAPRAGAQTPPWGRGQITLFGNFSQTKSTDGGPGSNFSELSANVSLASKPADDGGFEFGLDARGSEYPSSDATTNRLSLYNAWVGGRTSGGRLGLRVGQMWINDLGGLGSVGGVNLEVLPFDATSIGRFRFGLFGGLEPDLYQVGYVSGVKKYGGYVALDGELGWKNVLGYVQVKDQGVTERSVVTMLNFIPIGRDFFLYQAAEYDLSAPGGAGGGGGRLTYIFVNARLRATPWLEFQGMYHHGISIDTRSIAQDVLNGRPTDPRTLEGFLYGSIGGRVTIEPIRGIRVWGGYSQEQSSFAGGTYPRYQAGIYLFNLLGSGFDITASDYRYNQPSTGSYDSFYASIGHNIGSRVYLTLDYTTSLSTLSLTGPDGILVQTHPQSKRYSISGVVNLSRYFSLFLTAEQIRDDTSQQNRGLVGLSFRF
ncbi:MAG: hypothetical protein ACHQPI_14730 [Thermoanaerobaculia bacterium]